jgi:hypothetical protein
MTKILIGFNVADVDIIISWYWHYSSMFLIEPNLAAVPYKLLAENGLFRARCVTIVNHILPERVVFDKE